MISISSGNQTTIAHHVLLSGIGVHSGAEVTVRLHPGEIDSGVIFRRVFADGRREDIRAVSSKVVATDLCTVIGSASGATIGTIEHMMAAIAALDVDNIIIEVDGAEMPIMDGSARAFVEAIDEAVIVQLEARRRFIRVRKPVRVEMGGSWGEFLPHGTTRYEVTIDFDSAAIGRQVWAGDVTAGVFRSELARSRTFGFMRDVEKLWAAGFALGASLENAVVVSDDDSVINAEGLRYSDEFVRHKTLDAVGDLALAGAPIIGCFRSYRGGHKLNAIALKALLDDLSAYDIVEAPSAGAQRFRRADLVAVSPSFAPWAH
jgi:UDP-3-O-[3-hydroxymyristoyl] N-acetylglucosamine deacetylase